MKKLFLLLMGIILFSSIGYAATISGNVYDESLNLAKNSIVELNTTPKQTLVAKDGSYSFEVPEGNYALKATLGESFVEETLTVKKEGKYVIDLIIFPNIEEIPPIEDELTEEIAKEEQTANWKFILVIAGMIIVIFFVAYIIMKKRTNHPQSTGDLDDLVNIIKKHGGRTTQKEIRKEIPLSEAKISLMIAELEHKGIVEKIKKGRGNIIVLKR